MNFLQNWVDGFTSSLLGIWNGVAGFIPMLLGAVVLFLIGWILAVLIEKFVEHIFKVLKVDSLLKATGIEDVIERSGYKLNSGAFVGALVKWFVIVVFLVASFDVLHLNTVNEFLGGVVLSYLPKVIVSVLMLMVAAVIGDAVQKIVTASARAAHVHAASFLGSVAKWAIWITTLFIAVVQLGLDAGLLNIVFIGIIAALALATGLSFGLGCKEQASKIMDKIVRDIATRD